MEAKPDLPLDNMSLSINEPVQLRILEEKDRTACTSRVLDVTEGQIRLSWPLRSGIRVPIRKGQELTVYSYRSDGIHSGKGIVEEVLSGPTSQVVVRLMAIFEKVQRRQFCRVRVALPVRLTGIKSLSSGREPKHAGEMCLIATALDISGGGFSIHKEFSIPAGTRFKTCITLQEHQSPLVLNARVVHSESVELLQGRQIYRIALSFVGITEAQRQLIMQHIFKLQQSLVTPA